MPEKKKGQRKKRLKIRGEKARVQALTKGKRKEKTAQKRGAKHFPVGGEDNATKVKNEK